MRLMQEQKCDIRIIQPYPITHQFKAGTEFEGKSLLHLMTVRFPFKKKEEWRMKINSGLVGINGSKALPESLLKNSDEIFHHNPHVIEPSVPAAADVLQDESDYLLIYKPAPMPMHPGGRYFKNTLTAILEEKGYHNLRIVHRLDAVTSGIVLFAKNKIFAKKAMICFTQEQVQKVYYAHVSGIPKESYMEIDTPIRRKNGFVFESHAGLENSKKAFTKFEVVESYEHSSLIKCLPVTGRTHQIRLHLEHWGFPIIDDPIYGPKGDKSSRKTQNKSISLINAGLKIEELGIDYNLSESFVISRLIT